MIVSFALLLVTFGLSACKESYRAANRSPVLQERTISISGRPAFEKRVGVVYLRIDSDKNGRLIGWNHILTTDALDPTRSYDFDLIEQFVRQEPGKDQTISLCLVKIHEGTRSLYDGSICQKHHFQMERKEVPIRYGLGPGPNDEAPNDGTIRGGCVISEESPETGFSWVCPTCKSIHDEAVARKSREER